MSKDIQIARNQAIHHKRKAREAGYLKGGCGAMVVHFFIMPLCVVALNHWYGWKVAVISFPVLIYFSRNILPFAKSIQKRSFVELICIYVLRFAVFVLPFLSIYFDMQNWMRIWALLIACSLFVKFGIDVNIRNSITRMIAVDEKRSAFVSVGVILFTCITFAILSELLWHYAGFSIWIWYHSFFMIILVLLVLAVAMVPYSIFGRRVDDDLLDKIIEKRNPPLEGSSGEQYDVFLRKPNRVFHKYRSITFHQAKTIFDKVKWTKELEVYQSEQNESVENSNPAFLVEFGGAYQFRLEPTDANFTKLNWTSPKKRKFYEAWVTPNQHEAFNVPLELVPELMQLAWIEEWDVVTNKLQAYMKAET